VANPRDAELDIIANDKTLAGTSSAARNFDHLKRKVNEVDGANKRLTSSSMKLARASDGVGTSLIKVASVLRAGGLILGIGALGAGIAALPTLAQLAAGSLVGVLGGGLLTLGIISAAQNKKIKKEWSDLKDHVQDVSKNFAKPFVPVLSNLLGEVRKTFDYFTPTITVSLGKIAPVFRQFFRRAFDAIREELQPVIPVITDSFNRIIAALGPAMPKIINNIATAFQNLAIAVNNNPDAIADFIVWTTKAMVVVSRFIVFLSQLKINAQIAWASVGLAVNDAVADMAESLAKIPGIGERMFGEFARTSRAKADEAQRAIDRLNTKKSQGEVQALRARIEGLRGKVVQVRNDPVAKIKAEREIAELQGRINALTGKTVSVTVRYQYLVNGHVTSHRPSNALVDAAMSGGVSWSPIRMDGGSYGRTEAPAQPIVNVAAPNVNTTVVFDGGGLDRFIDYKVNTALKKAGWDSTVKRR
jgi:hypothetical protein